MGVPRFTGLSGTTDGANAVFTTPVAYTSGTIALYLNGQLLTNPAGNPWLETSPSTGTITITEAECIPLAGETVSAFFLDTLEAFTGSTITPISGVVASLKRLIAAQTLKIQISGAVSTPSEIGAIFQNSTVKGVVLSPSKICGKVSR